MKLRKWFDNAYRVSYGTRGSRIIEANGWKSEIIFPTPRATDCHFTTTKGRFKRESLDLGTYVLIYPNAGEGQRVTKSYGVALDLKRELIESPNVGFMNPAFAEWLMGTPIGWTNIEVGL